MRCAGRKSGLRSAGLGAWRYAFGYASTAILLIVSVHFAWSHSELFLRLLSSDPRWLSVVAVVLLVNLIARAHFLRKTVREFGGDVSARDSFYLTAATNMLAVLTLPAAGVAYKGLYLYKRHGLQVPLFAGSTAIFAAIGVLIWCSVGIGGVMGSGVAQGYQNDLCRPLFILALATVAAIAFVFPARSTICATVTGRGRIAQFTSSCVRAMSSRRLGNAAMWTMLSCTVAQVCGFYLIFRSFDVQTGISELVSLVAFHQLSGVVGLTPGSLGLQEGASLLWASVADLDVLKLAIVLGLVRIARIIMSIGIGVPCWWLLSNQTRGPSSTSGLANETRSLALSSP